MKQLLLLASLLWVLTAAAQKVVRKVQTLPPDQLLRIEAGECYRVELQTRPGGDLEAEATLDGEYDEKILLQMGTEGSTTIITAGVTPLFDLPDDKLGAHKVVSIALRVSVPEFRRVQVYAGSAALTAKGQYENLTIFLEAGSCFLSGVGQATEVSTRGADIYVESAAANVRAESRYGEVSPNKIPPGTPRFTLSTISGDIHLIRME